MSNVNTKLKDFYEHGYRDAVVDCTSFLKSVEEHFGHISMDDGLTLGKFIATITDKLNGLYGSNIDERESHVE